MSKPFYCPHWSAGGQGIVIEFEGPPAMHFCIACARQAVVDLGETTVPMLAAALRIHDAEPEKSPEKSQ